MVGWFYLLSLANAVGLRYEMTPGEVAAAMGAPSSKLKRGDRSIWNYPEGGQVVFELGWVVRLVKMRLASEAEVLAAQAAAQAEVDAAAAEVDARLAAEAAAEAPAEAAEMAAMKEV
jgi:hypothetical protein